jgi:class 3 adenylate cyclase
MACPNCQFENPAGAKFCQNCGQPLPRPCPNCGTVNQASAKFCMNCGTKLGDAGPAGAQAGGSGGASQPVADPRLARLAAATPLALAEKIRASAHLAGERRVVTALFADVVGSTALAEQMDPEDWTAIMNNAFERLVPVVYRYEGTIARLMGDALLAFFGAPVAHEDDPARAVSAGLDLIAAARDYAREVRPRYGIDFEVRVGLNTGPVVVGGVGNDLVYEYTAMGDAVNLAARMQSAARPMSVLITENTYRFIAPVFNVSDLGAISIKGKTDPVRTYEVTGPKVKPGKLRGLSGFASPMVGREVELNALLRNSAAVHAGLGRAVLVTGEAGLGKSRLIEEWKARALGEEEAAVAAVKAAGDQDHGNTIHWAEGHCLSYGQGLAYHLLIDLLRSLLGVPAAAGELETRSALSDLTRNLFGEANLEVYPYLGHLLSLELEGAALDKVRMLDPQALQTQYLAALRQLLRTLANLHPIILVLDDIHWADPSSIELLVKMLSLVTEVPLLFCCVTRPDQDSPGSKLVAAIRETMGAGLTELNLQALSETDSRQLISNLLEIEELPETIREAILAKAEGNPFFVEEVIRMLIDRGGIVQQEGAWVAQKEIENLEIPDNLQGLLLARIDRLPDDVKRTLRVASVIGRQFSVKVLEQVLASQNES